MIESSQVSAVLVTRGDVDLGPVVGPIVAAGIKNVVIWDNASRPVDLRVFGRYAALAETAHDVVFFQDDDVTFSAFEELFAAYEPGVLTANMDPGWVEKGRYQQTVCVGAGAVADKEILLDALARYQSVYPADPWLTVECDLIVGTLVETRKLDLGYRVQPWATDSSRLCRQPWQTGQKLAAMERAEFVRDRVLA